MLTSASRNTLKRAGKCTDISKAILRSGSCSTLIPKDCQWRQTSSVAHEKPLPSPIPRGSFTLDNADQGLHHKTSLVQHNLLLAKAADSEDFIGALRRCKKMKEEGIQPDLSTYNNLLGACSHVGMGLEAWAIFEDLQVAGLTPNHQTFFYLINALRRGDSRSMWEAVEKMREFGISLNTFTCTLIISRYISNGNLELALQFLYDMNARSLVPELKVVQGVILLATRLGYPRLALDLATSFEEESVRKLGPEVWMNCLIASAQDLYVDGVTQCWDMAIHQLNILPDEGTCNDVLHTAARHGLPELATDVIRVLHAMGATSREHHFAAVIEAFCRADNIKEAFLILDVMRSKNIRPVSSTTSPIFEAISKDVDALDATWSIVEEIHEEGKHVDVEVMNVIVQAAVSLGDLQRAIGTYKTYTDYGVKPTIDTFNWLLAGCVGACHRELGDRLLTEMKEAKLKPNSRTYENIILLCLTQTTYEDAFFYLEEMKAGKHVPSLMVYETLIQKCFSVGDSRYKLALEEMRQCGYEIPRRLKTIVG